MTRKSKRIQQIVGMQGRGYHKAGEIVYLLGPCGIHLDWPAEWRWDILAMGEEEGYRRSPVGLINTLIYLRYLIDCIVADFKRRI